MPAVDTAAEARVAVATAHQAKLATLRELLAAGCPHGCLKACRWTQEMEQRIATALRKRGA